MTGILMGLLINKGVKRNAPVVDGGSKFDEVMWYVGNDYVEKPDTAPISHWKSSTR